MHLKILHFSRRWKISGAVEKLLFTYLWNRYHEQIPGMKSIQIGTISILLCHHKRLFHCWKDIWCWKLPRRVATSEKDRLHIYSLWHFFSIIPLYAEIIKTKFLDQPKRRWAGVGKFWGRNTSLPHISREVEIFILLTSVFVFNFWKHFHFIPQLFLQCGGNNSYQNKVLFSLKVICQGQ
jgi:hypothetical protein